ncbi:NAD(P)/FAD-dependent oxidoreductase [Phytomonospora sp. NPDC050363]|uniref:FAD-dependent oxidoreductase n=1 Tax=Phytomonospora sp. NPDC050363 TaxID=3155642 RepID=UPI0033F04ABC
MARHSGGDDRLHVLIIGAGTGGMCLAHGLRNAGISVAVYERDKTRADGLHGYRVGISPTGARSLRECLSPELFDTFVATCARPPRHFNVYTEKLGRVASFEIEPPEDPGQAEHSVSRMTLRQVLLSDMDDVVEYGKTFTRYEQTPDGRVTAHFADGTTATGDLLVAADGTNSPVRRQFLPDAVVRDSGVIAIAAKAPSTPENRALVPEVALNGISTFFAPKGQFMILHSMEFPWDHDGKVKDGVGGNDAELIARWPGLLYDNTRDYLNWGLSASAGKFPADVMNLRGPELMRVALDMTGAWHADVRELMRRSDPASCFAVRIRTSEPVEAWQPGNVTLLGDAIHTMTPGMGVGANTALRDATLLTRELVAVAEGGKKLTEAVGDYEAEMLPYGTARVADSLAQNGMSGSDPLHRPFIGRIVLAVARTFFRANDKIPALRRRFIAGLREYRGSDAEA